MKVAVKKDGHHFYTHINQVIVDPEKPPSQTQNKKISDPKEDCSGINAGQYNDIKQYPQLLFYNFTQMYSYVKEKPDDQNASACVSFSFRAHWEEKSKAGLLLSSAW